MPVSLAISRADAKSASKRERAAATDHAGLPAALVRAIDREKREHCRRLVWLVAAALAVLPENARVRLRRPCSPALVPQCAMYLAHVVFAFSFADIGHAFGRDRRTVAHACRVMETRRDDPVFDAVLEALESACAARQRSVPEARP